jgi:Rod binding domain-containing protein
MNTLSGLISSTGSRLADFGDPKAAKQSAPSDQESFAAIMSRANARPGASAKTPRDKAREAAQQLIATALVQPVLKQLRETNNAAEPFKPNAAEKSFGQMMDTQLSQRIVESKGWALVDRVTETLLRKSTTGAST